MMEYREATTADLDRLWDKNIARNPEDERWVRWKKEYMDYNARGQAKTFAIVCDCEPVGEGTLLLDPQCKAVGGRLTLADGIGTANVNALRIEKAYEGQGHISHMMACLEQYARECGCHELTIGVEARETRNLAIYLHWGYCRFVESCVEDEELVLYYAKKLDS